jgi:MFS family permease
MKRPFVLGQHRWRARLRRDVVLGHILGSSMAFIDSSAVNVALPVIQRDLGASAAQVQWVVGSPVVSWCAVLVGGRSAIAVAVRVFVWGVSVFALFRSGAVSPGAGQLILARAAQVLAPRCRPRQPVDHRRVLR